MRVFALVIMVVLAGVVAAQELGNALPPKMATVHAPGAPDPEVIRQGGDDWDDAFVIPSIPFEDAGTTVGYSVNCCAEMCPYEAWGPAVFYRFAAPADMDLRIDLCGSNYDTGLYLYEVDGGLAACNVDYYGGPPCGLYVSCIRYTEVVAGQDYFIVVTGMSGDSGNYVLSVDEEEECVIDAPPGVVLEGEPELVGGYQDAYNGGCNSPEFGNPFQTLVGDPQGELLFLGVAGWYVVPPYDVYRDTDWFLATIGEAGVLDVTLLAELGCYAFEIGPQDCDAVQIVQAIQVEECGEASMQITGDPGDVVWLWVGSDSFGGPSWFDDTEYDYLLTITGLQPGPVATEQHSWSAVRSLFR